MQLEEHLELHRCNCANEVFCCMSWTCSPQGPRDPGHIVLISVWGWWSIPDNIFQQTRKLHHWLCVPNRHPQVGDAVVSKTWFDVWFGCVKFGYQHIVYPWKEGYQRSCPESCYCCVRFLLCLVEAWGQTEEYCCPQCSYHASPGCCQRVECWVDLHP